MSYIIDRRLNDKRKSTVNRQRFCVVIASTSAKPSMMR